MNDEDTARRSGMLIKELKPDSDKRTRALPATAAMEGGQVYFRAGARWLATFEDEVLSFPDAVHDDQVDCLSYACWLFGQSRRGDTKRGYKPAPPGPNKPRTPRNPGRGGKWRIGR